MSREAHAIVQAINELTEVMKEIRDTLNCEEVQDSEAAPDPSNYII